MFDSVYEHLNTNGLFLFDVFSYDRFLDADKTNITEEFDDFTYNWKMSVELPNTLHHDITISGIDNFEEHYDEHYYDYKELINDPRFELVKIVGDFKKKLTKHSERILIILKKI
jgi:hypothetical protein